MRVFNEYKDEILNETTLKKKKEKNKNSKDKKKRKTGILNLTEMEQQGMKSLKRRIKEGEIVITSTDKSGRLAALNKLQYIQSGEKHTSKDKIITWKDIKYIQGQVNEHTWWTAKILGYSKTKDEKRMFKNLHEASSQVPEMMLLVKDHKSWSFSSGKAIPSRPVIFGKQLPEHTFI